MCPPPPSNKRVLRTSLSRVPVKAGFIALPSMPQDGGMPAQCSLWLPSTGSLARATPIQNTILRLHLPQGMYAFQVGGHDFLRRSYQVKSADVVRCSQQVLDGRLTACDSPQRLQCSENIAAVPPLRQQLGKRQVAGRGKPHTVETGGGVREWWGRKKERDRLEAEKAVR